MMDWSKAKTILIIALLITNSLLGYALYIEQDQEDATIEEKFIEESIKLLEKKDIKLDTEIPVYSANLLGLTVEYEIQEITFLNNEFFNGEGQVNSEGEGLFTITHDNETITVINDKLVIYEASPKKVIYDIRTREEAVKIAQDFLKNKGFSISDMALSFVRESKGVYNIEFTKIFDDNFLESTFTNIQLDNRGISKLERNWLNMKAVGTNPIHINTAPKSILALISKEEVYGKTISDISLSYYFDPEKHKYNINPGEAQQGTTVPAWRIQFSDGYKIIIDNY